MSILKKWFSEDSDRERAQFRRELADSVEAQDNLMMADIAKVIHKMPEGSSVVALRKYRGTVFAGLVVPTWPNGDMTLTVEMWRKGLLNPVGSPGSWIPASKVNLLSEFTDPPDAALAFFVLTPTGQYALAFSHLVRSDGQVHWVSDEGYICRVAEVLVEAGLVKAGAEPSEHANGRKPTTMDSSEILQSARELHEALQSWMRMLFTSLEQRGTSQEDAALQMAGLLGKMEGASKQWPPPIAALAMTSVLTSYIQYLTTEEGGLNGITADLAIEILGPLMRLGDGLDALLKEEGWRKEQIAVQVSTLSENVIAITRGAVPGIAPLTFAFAADNYSKLLLKGMLTSSIS